MTAAAVASPVQTAGRRLGRPRGGEEPADQAGRDGGARPDHQGRGAAHRRLVPERRRWSGASAYPSCSRCWRSTTSTPTVQGLDTVPLEDQPPVNVVRYAFQSMVGAGTHHGRWSPCCSCSCAGASGGCRPARGSTAPWCSAARCRSSRCSPAGSPPRSAGNPGSCTASCAPRRRSPAPPASPSGYGVLAAVYLGLLIAVVLGRCVRLARTPLPSRPSDADAVYPLSRVE